MQHKNRKAGKRILSFCLSLLIASGGIIFNPFVAHAYYESGASSTMTVYNYGQVSRHFHAGSSYWTSTFNRFSSSLGNPAYCLREGAAPPPNGTGYDSAEGEVDYYYYCALHGNDIASQMGISGDNAYFGIQYAIWQKYCTGSGLSTVGDDSDSQQVLNLARAIYNQAINCSADPMHRDYLLQNDVSLSYIKNKGDYISGSNYVIGDYSIYGPFSSATVNTTGSTAGVSVTKVSSNQIQVTIPLANVTNGYSAKINLNASKPFIQFFQFKHTGYQEIGTLQWNTANDTTQLNEIKDSPQGQFNIYKTDSYNGASLANATFKLTNEATGAVQYKTTNASGYTYFYPLPVGSYTVEETAPPTGYKLSGTTKWTGQQITDTVTTHDYHVQNDPLFGAIKVKKSSEDGIVANRTFNISGNGVNANITTGADGSATLNNLYAGTYTVSEVNTAAQYISPPPQSVTVNYSTTTTVNFTNTLKKGYVELNKTDAETGNPLANALFGIYNNSGLRIGSFITNSSGYAKSSLINYGSNYYLMEETAPTGYVLDSSHLPFSITSNGQLITLNKANSNQKGSIQITKTDSETGKPLANATYEIRAAEDITTGDGTVRAHSGELVDTVTSAANGTATSKQLYLGKYEVKEKAAPQGYVLDSQSHLATLSYAGQLISVTSTGLNLTDTAQKAQIKITKADKETGKPLASAVYEIRAVEDILTGDGTVRFHNGELVDTLTTADDGSTTSRPLYLGKYEVKEKTAPQGYVLDNDSHPVTLAYAGQTVTTYIEPLAVNDTPQKAQINITKTDKDTKKVLANAVYEIFAAEDITTGDGTLRAHSGDLVDTVTIGADGTATSKLLYLGKYNVQEKTAPNGYVLDKDFHSVTLSYKGQTEESFVEQLSVTDLPQQATIKVSKTDSGTDKPLSNAVYEIYAAEDIRTGEGTVRAYNGDLMDTITTKADGTAESKLLYLGKYNVQEKTAPQGYVLDNETHPVTLAYAKQTVATYTEPLAVTDSPQQAIIKIPKTDYETKNPLSEAVYDIYALQDILTADGTVRTTAGELVDTVKTGLDGSVESKPFHLGNYIVKERTAPPGYVLDPNTYPVTLDYAGQTVTTYTKPLPVTDEAQKAQIEINKSGKMLDGFTMSHSNFGDIFSPVYKNSTLQGAKFNIIADEDILTTDGTIRAKKDTVVDTVITGEDGSVLSKQLYLGKYRIEEIQPPTGYVLDASPHRCALVYKDQTVNVYQITIDVRNERQKAKVALHKTIEQLEPPDKGKPDDTQVNMYRQIIFGLYSEDDFFMPDGTLALQKDSLLETISPDKQGNVTFQTDLPFGQYYVKELQTITGYVLDETKYPVQFEYGGSDKEKTIPVNENQPIENKLIRGSLHIIKTDEDTGQNLDGAVFGRYDSAGQLQQTFTAQNGEYLIENLPYQEGYIQELKAPDGYQLNPDKYPYSITNNNQVVEISVKDKKMPVIVDTGDHANYPPIIFGTATSLAVLTVCCAQKRKKRKYAVKK